MSGRLRWVLLGIFVLVMLSACAAGPNAAVDVPADDGDVAGFWSGLWHGIIAPVTFFGLVGYARISGHWDTPVPDAVYRELVPSADVYAHPQ